MLQYRKMPKFRDYIYKVREIAEIISTSFGVLSAVSILLNVCGAISSITLPYLSIPTIAMICYLLAKLLPMGVAEIRARLNKLNTDNLTEDDKLQLDEMKTIVDTLSMRDDMSRRSEPISNTETIYVDIRGNSYTINRNNNLPNRT
jgi:hypothetical protein